ncbi:hypothetical protein Glove_349g106 [Diversispora epigaea]|uniref:Uncharacterized protein n=1 Tax=Diversispora epigaea TaxID=1348612 RepID=A0A397HGV0_9GLOM|nr:hypothetical protein Glove_349g106 [Diversispora epigaea]
MPIWLNSISPKTYTVEPVYEHTLRPNAFKQVMLIYVETSYMGSPTAKKGSHQKNFDYMYINLKTGSPVYMVCSFQEAFKIQQPLEIISNKMTEVKRIGCQYTS